MGERGLSGSAGSGRGDLYGGLEACALDARLLLLLAKQLGCVLARLCLVFDALGLEAARHLVLEARQLSAALLELQARLVGRLQRRQAALLARLCIPVPWSQRSTSVKLRPCSKG